PRRAFPEWMVHTNRSLSICLRCNFHNWMLYTNGPLGLRVRGNFHNGVSRDGSLRFRSYFNDRTGHGRGQRAFLRGLDCRLFCRLRSHILYNLRSKLWTLDFLFVTHKFLLLNQCAAATAGSMFVCAGAVPAEK